MTKQTNNPLGSVVGYDKQIRRLTEILNIVNHADRYETFDIETPKSLLLYGEVDVGKTFMARAFVDGCERNVFEITECCNSYKKLHKLFLEAKKYAPSVIFADEIDSCPEDMIAALAEEMASVNALFIRCMVAQFLLPCGNYRCGFRRQLQDNRRVA